MIIKGDSFTDDRGTLQFVNDFNFNEIKRFYIIHHPDKNIIRAWQGHKTETKHFYVIKGSFLINWIEIDNFENPAKDFLVQSKTMIDKQSEVLIIPPGHVSNSDNFRWGQDYFNANWDDEVNSNQ